jgi:D-serine deaminase-like pyridoxal phosphate-dependent protein
MTTTTRAAVLAEHGLTDCVIAQLPPLRARNHAEAAAALKARRAALLDHAEHLTFLAGAFSDVPEVVDVLVCDARAALDQAGRCLPGGAR